MSHSTENIDEKFLQLNLRLSELESLNRFLTKEVKEYFLLYNVTRQLITAHDLKEFYKALDSIFLKIFEVDEYALILKNKNSDILSVQHSHGLARRKLREIFYRETDSLVGKVFSRRQAIHIPDTSVLKGFSYYFEPKVLQGSLYYLPIIDLADQSLGVLKLRKIKKDGFSEAERNALTALEKIFGQSLSNARKIDTLAATSFIDKQTLLYNRRYYRQHFQTEFKRAQRYNHPLSLLLLRVRNFYRIFLSNGDLTEEEALREIASLLLSNIRTGDICIRHGKYDFLILLPETNGNGAQNVAVKLKEEFLNYAESKNLDSQFLLSNFMLGTSSYQEDTIEPKKLIEIATEKLEALRDKVAAKPILSD